MTAPVAGPRDADDQRVEDLAHAFSAFGLSRMAGRILGCLLLSGEPQESLDSLAKSLGASKGSMSTMARHLVSAGLIEQVAVPGSRRDWYRLRRGAWDQLNRDRIEALSRLGTAAADVAGGKAGPALADLRSFCAAAEEDLAGLGERCLPRATSERTGDGADRG